MHRCPKCPEKSPLPVSSCGETQYIPNTGNCQAETDTAHWLAVEGVQPTIPQNPTSADSRNQELHPRGAGTNNASLAALTGDDNITVRPLVKHILSKELQLYFDRICSAILDPDHDDYRIAAFSSLGTDPGLHQLVPYFVQFIAEKVTHNLKDIFVLTQMMTLTSAMLENASLYIDPYVASIVPPILTCLVGRRLGDVQKPAHFDLRDLAASLIGRIATKYGKTSQTLKPRLARTCLKHFLDPHKPLGVHYGAIAGLVAVGGTEVVRVLIVPNLKAYESVIRDHLTESSPRWGEAEKVVRQLMKALETLEKEQTQFSMTNGNGAHGGERLQARINDKVGEVIGTRLVELGNMAVIHAILD